MSQLTVYNPYNLEELRTLEFETEESLEKKLSIAYSLWSQHPNGIPRTERKEVLDKLAELMKDQVEELASLAASEGGKPLVDSRGEVLRAINGVELARDYIDQMNGEEIPMNLNKASEGKDARTIIEPIGVVAAISAFNHPLNLIVHQAVTAFAAGCPVIVKPALTTPLSCIKLVDLLAEAGAPEGWVQTLIVEDHLAEKFARDPRVNYLTFIGSAKVGWYLRSKIADGTRIALEHGGVAPVIVHEDADLDAMIAPLLKGAFYHAGQVCVSVQKIFIPESLKEEFVSKMKAGAEKLVVGDPLDDKTEIGPFIKPEELSRVQSWVDDAMVQGAELVCGGNRISETCMEATILLNPSQSSDVSTKEIFGPVVCIYTYSDVEEAIRIANSLEFHFQAAVWSADKSKAEDTARKLNAAAVMINNHTAFRVDWMPFGGRDSSGLGIGGIKYSMDEMSRHKLIVSSNI